MTNTAAITIWQPIETAPKDGTEVLLAYPKGYVLIGRYVDKVQMEFGKVIREDQYWETGRMWIPSFGPEPQPTHWMPLPAAPKIDAEAAA